MREAAERRQQLELEHEQALAVLNAKQQEIELLQKVSGERESQVEKWIAVRRAQVMEQISWFEGI